jgi:SAM-dependent methyltransferase
MARTPFMTRCLSCAATITNLSLIPIIQGHLAGNASAKSAYELSSYGATLKWLVKNMGSVTKSEYFPNRPRGSTVDNILNEDIQNLTFAENSFDVLTSNQVFEHVPDDIVGFRESRRVLKPGGAVIFSVPLYDTPTTVQTAVLEDGKVIFYGEPEYHDSRVGGARSAPVFRRYSFHDICSRVLHAGFSTAELKEVIIAPSQGAPAMVVYAVK